MWTNRLVFILLLGVLLCSVLCLAIGVYNVYVYSPHAWSGLRASASRLGFEPTYEGLALYISQEIEPGMSRGQVQQTLETIGTVRWKRESEEEELYPPGIAYCDSLVLELPTVNPVLLHRHRVDVAMPLLACYNTGGELIELSYDASAWESDHPILDIHRPPRRNP
jgi:hypothetical protein